MHTTRIIRSSSLLLAIADAATRCARRVEPTIDRLVEPLHAAAPQTRLHARLDRLGGGEAIAWTVGASTATVLPVDAQVHEILVDQVDAARLEGLAQRLLRQARAPSSRAVVVEVDGAELTLREAGDRPSWRVESGAYDARLVLVTTSR